VAVGERGREEGWPKSEARRGARPAGDGGNKELGFWSNLEKFSKCDEKRKKTKLVTFEN
jgi:hypothetical protein